MTTYLWGLGTLYNLIGVWLVWYTWPVMDEAKRLRTASAPLIVTFWPLYVIGALLVCAMLWLMDDTFSWRAMLSRQS